MKRFVQKIFGLNALYDRMYGYEFFVRAIIAVVMLMLVWLWVGGNAAFNEVPIFPWLLLSFLSVISVLYLTRELVRCIVVQVRLDGRVDRDQNIAAVIDDSKIFGSAIRQELGDQTKMYVIESDNMHAIYDLLKEIYSHTRSGDYKSKEIYYTVFEYKLQRNMPHVIFDGRYAKGRQFKKYYIAEQKISLEGNFSSHFDVYMPEYYQIDTLSFITPEVMQAMLACGSYDFEIRDDSLLCYAPLLDKNELQDAKKRVEDIYRVLNDNLDSYRDDRLDYIQSKQSVTPFGSALLLNPNVYIPAIVVNALAIVLTIYFGFLISRTWLYVIFTFVLFYELAQLIGKYRQRVHLNKLRIEEFRTRQKYT